MKSFVVLVMILGTTLSVFAQLDGNPENLCRNGAFPRESESYSIARVAVKRAARSYFYGDEGDCPKAKNCRRRSYLVRGDEVIVSRKYGNYACAWYQPKKGPETVGWIAASDLEFLNLLDAGGASYWTGTWRYYDSTIKIAPGVSEGTFKVTGEAFWRGLGDNIHIGEIDGMAIYDAAGTALLYGFDMTGEYDCRVTLRRAGRFMIVADNLNCGGVNVTFSGVYLRK